jgi:2-dehydro-3-deoxygluconokinase
MVELTQAKDGLLRKGFAGDTFNAAYYARAALPSNWAVDYFTALGVDQVSDEMLRFMEGAGIGTHLISRIPDRMPGLYMVHLQQGERSFSYWRSASAARCLAENAILLRTAIEGADTILFSGITLAILGDRGADTLLVELRRAKAAGKLVAFDPNIRPQLWQDAARMRAILTEGAQACNLVLPSFDDESSHFGDATIDATIDRYRTLGINQIVVKNGGQGINLSFDDVREHVPAIKVAQVVDTTGAGDSFNGLFLAHFAVTGDSVAAARLAAKVAARVIGQHGALIRGLECL